MTGYTPTTEQVRTEWALSNPGGSPTTIMHAEAAFDRWLAEHDRQVAERAWDEGARWAAVELGAIDNERQAWITPSDNPYRRTEEEK